MTLNVIAEVKQVVGRLISPAQACGSEQWQGAAAQSSLLVPSTMLGGRRTMWLIAETFMGADFGNSTGPVLGINGKSKRFMNTYLFHQS